MIEILRAYFERDGPITDEQFDLIQSRFVLRHLKKGEFLLREGEVARYGAFVAKGCLRSYVLDNKGKQHIVQFAPENWWLTDTDSIMQNKPTIYSPSPAVHPQNYQAYSHWLNILPGSDWFIA